jgi:splicing factor 3A subunit 2
MQNATSRAKASEYYDKNHLGQPMCRLCSTQHRDDDNFVVHLESKRHQTNLRAVERAKTQYAKEQSAAIMLQDQMRHQEHRANMEAQLGTVSGAPQQQKKRRGPVVGRPNVKYHTEPLPDGRACKVMFELDYPLAPAEADDGMALRPLHQWLNAHAQSVEPRNDELVYLVFACESYESVAYTFPAHLPVTTAESVRHHAEPEQLYYCSWDPLKKIYTLMFVIGRLS